MSQRVPPLSFLLFCYRMRVYKSKRVSPFTFFGTVRHFPKDIFFEIFKFFSKKNVLRFLSLRYSADLRRSRLVYFLNVSYKTGRDFVFFGTVRLFSEFFLSRKGSPFDFLSLRYSADMGRSRLVLKTSELTDFYELNNSITISNYSAVP